MLIKKHSMPNLVRKHCLVPRCMLSRLLCINESEPRFLPLLLLNRYVYRHINKVISNLLTIAKVLEYRSKFLSITKDVHFQMSLFVGLSRGY